MLSFSVSYLYSDKIWISQYFDTVKMVIYESRMNERNYHHGDLRTALVQAGRTILERDGLSALTLRACAREAGVSHAAPQHHFRNLAELLSAIAASGFEDFVAFLDKEASGKPTPRQRLLAMGNAYVHFSALHPALYRLMFGVETAQVKSEGLLQAMSKAWAQLHGCVVDAAGETDSAGKAALVWSVVHGHAMLQAAQYAPPVVKLEAQLDHSLDMMAIGIGAA